jgi:hypothetical protein
MVKSFTTSAATARQWAANSRDPDDGKMKISPSK